MSDLNRDYRGAEKEYVRALRAWEKAQEVHQAVMANFAPPPLGQDGGTGKASPAPILSSTIFKSLQEAAEAEQLARSRYLEARARFIELAERWHQARGG